MKGFMSITNKATHVEISASGNELSLSAPSVVQLAVKRADIKNIERQGDMLVVTLASGTVVKIHGFFPAQGPQQNDFVINNENHLWLVEFSNDGQIVVQYDAIDSIEPLLVNESFDLSNLAWVLGGLALVGAVAGGGGSGGHDPVALQDTAAPTAPTVAVTTNPDGSLTIGGTAEPGTTVKVTNPDGSTET
ncbi:BapA/Bap/LapF family prefix-like domain-containing protein, partial [Pseudomonas yamanorum]